MVYEWKKLQEIIERYVAAAQMLGVRVEQVWLHGECATGFPTRFATIDLAVMSSEFEGVGMFEVLEGLDMAANLLPDSVPLRISAFHTGDYTAETTCIRKNGRLVWEASKPARLAC